MFRYTRFLERERERLLAEIERLRADARVERDGYRRYIDQLLRRLFEKEGVPQPAPPPPRVEIPADPTDLFGDVSETDEDRTMSREMDEFVR